MLVIDRENDRALLSKQSRFVPRMWSCLAGFIEVSALANLRTTWGLNSSFISLDLFVVFSQEKA